MLSVLHHYNCVCSMCAGLKVPPAVKKRGRPKGHNLTTVGLPAKKAKKDSGAPLTFIRLHTSEKVKGTCTSILCVYVYHVTCNICMSCTFIREHE